MTHCKRGLVAGILFLAVALRPAAAVSGPFEDGVEAYGSGDYATALRLWRPLVEQGHAGAQFNLGIMYGNGRGVPQDYAEAGKWFGLAAEQGDAEAQYNLGVMYDNGQGVPQDYAEAAKWYRLAAEQGHAGAEYNLGYMYDEGRGVPQDYTEAHKWFNLAAVSGDAEFATARDQVATMMLPAQIAEAQKLAREWQAAFDARQE